MKAILRVLLSLLICGLTTIEARADDNPLTADSKSTYHGVKRIILRTAETMPEEKYSFKPVDTVRTFGQILGHIADSQYTFCSAVLGEKSPGLRIEKTKTSKTDLIAALEAAFGHCDRAYASLTDASGTETVKFMGGKPKLGVLSVN
ncbi:MAG TPA: DinB family protein, partial [Thermoanaerobaculia bacterium]|nr:DinB family protein [Thermoanaerobaculia bacterium]